METNFLLRRSFFSDYKTSPPFFILSKKIIDQGPLGPGVSEEALGAKNKKQS